LCDGCRIHLVDEDGTLRRVAAHQVDPAVDLERTDHGLAGVIGSGEPLVHNGEPRAYLAVPMRVRGQTLGAFPFARGDPPRRFDDEDLTVATDLAQRAALALENQRLYRATQHAVSLRDEFLSVASHELRTPVTSLQIAVQSALSVGDGAPPGFLR